MATQTNSHTRKDFVMAKAYPLVISTDDAMILDVVFNSHLNTLREYRDECHPGLVEIRQDWQRWIDERSATYQRIMAALNVAELVEIS